MLFTRIQFDRKEAMKARQQFEASLLGCIIADATKQDKEPDDETVIKAIRAQVKACNETLKINPDLEEPKQELEILQAYLPRMVEESDLRTFIDEQWRRIGRTDRKNMGRIMSAIKKKFGNRVDMQLASSIIKET